MRSSWVVSETDEVTLYEIENYNYPLVWWKIVQKTYGDRETSHKVENCWKLLLRKHQLSVGLFLSAAVSSSADKQTSHWWGMHISFNTIKIKALVQCLVSVLVAFL
ncbi:hypothetical protein POM88_012451 [Heracleum sosnowskyi]|uniref:Uncharacterized protein n=1 Tax=Heracleum sosnowskyi TaxID=360622 RepID=A0AAD8IWT6_9APIA|nr:hypothetical protein POM88_012451 [Heracleum sosnowskyi]